VGWMHMLTGEIRTVMRGMSDVGETLDAAWAADRSAIAEHEAGMGSDLLGQAFKGVYATAAQATADAAGRVGPGIMDDAAVAVRSAVEYVNADALVSEAIRAALGGGTAAEEAGRGHPGAD
jgi:hypothetical protein